MWFSVSDAEGDDSVAPGRKFRAAQVELLRAGMQLGEASSIYLPGGEEDSVLQQDPAPGTTDVTSPHVDLLVSLGPRPPAFVMPELSGLQFSEAESKLNASGLEFPNSRPSQRLRLLPVPWWDSLPRAASVWMQARKSNCKSRNRNKFDPTSDTGGLPATNLCNRLSRRGVNTVLPRYRVWR